MSPARVRALSLCASLAVFLAIAYHFRTELIDDAYISLTYARNLARGHGLVWNPGEAVEGYTDFLWVIVLSLTGASPVAAWVIGALAGAAGIAVLALAPRTRALPPLAAAVVPVALAVNLSYAFWAAKGLETALFTLLLTCGLLLFAADAYPNEAPAPGQAGPGARSASPPRPPRSAGGRDATPGGGATPGRLALLGLCLVSLSALTRPEGILFTALTALAGVRRFGWRIAWAVIPILLLGPHVAFRLAYYGYPFPNTYYAKVGFGPDQFLRGLDYVARFARGPGGALFVLALLFPRVASRSDRFLGAALLAGLLGVVYVGGDGFGAYRFLVPLFPILTLLAVSGAARAAASFPGSVSRWAGAALLVAVPAAAHLGTRGDTLAEEREVVRFTSLMKTVGEVLNRDTPPNTTIALNPAGAVPFYSDRESIDMLGLNDEHIAHTERESMGSHRAGHEKGDGAYVLSRKPELILIANVWVDDKPEVERINPSRRSEVQLVRLQELYDEYEIVYFTLPDGRYLKALARREGTTLPKSGWGPTSVKQIPVPKWR